MHSIKVKFPKAVFREVVALPLNHQPSWVALTGRDGRVVVVYLEKNSPLKVKMTWGDVNAPRNPRAETLR